VCEQFSLAAIALWLPSEKPALRAVFRLHFHRPERVRAFQADRVVLRLATGRWTARGRGGWGFAFEDWRDHALGLISALLVGKRP
jgi:hypothetical protein